MKGEVIRERRRTKNWEEEKGEKKGDKKKKTETNG